MIVDWPHAGILGLGKDDPGETDGFVFNDFNSVINAFYFKALNDMGEIARALSKNEGEDFFVATAKQVKSSYNSTFLDTHATLRLPTIKGQVLVDYSQTPNSFTMKVTIPANAKADIFVPLRKEAKPQMLLNCKKIKLIRSDNSWHLIQGVGSGQYIIEIKYLY